MFINYPIMWSGNPIYEKCIWMMVNECLFSAAFKFMKFDCCFHEVLSYFCEFSLHSLKSATLAFDTCQIFVILMSDISFRSESWLYLFSEWKEMYVWYDLIIVNMHILTLNI